MSKKSGDKAKGCGESTLTHGKENLQESNVLPDNLF